MDTAYAEPFQVIANPPQKRLPPMEDSIVLTLNIGTAKEQQFFGKTITTGICKEPVTNAIVAEKTGFVGDGIFNTKHHGGHDKAICVYPAIHLDHWRQELGTSLPTAPFGENLSLTVLSEDNVHIGDIFKIGTTLVEVSQPRQPCKTLSLRYNRPDFVKVVVQSGFTGWYVRVLETGTIKQGDRCTLVSSDPTPVSISFANQIMHSDRKNEKGIRQVLAIAALSESWQKSFQELLAKLQ